MRCAASRKRNPAMAVHFDSYSPEGMPRSFFTGIFEQKFKEPRTVLPQLPWKSTA
jgi:hypothetical protein